MQESFRLRAEENLQAAKLLFEARLYNASANRSYYAAYHAALAVIIAKGLKVSTDHKKVQATFNGEVIRRSKHISAHYKRYLVDLRSVREDADYEPHGVSQKTAASQLKSSMDFLTVIEEELRHE